MFLSFMGKRDQPQQHQQQQQQHFLYSEEQTVRARRTLPESEAGLEDFGNTWDEYPPAIMQQQQQRRHRQPTKTTPSQLTSKTKTYYPENHPMHPEDTQLNVKWPRSRLETRAPNEAAQTQAQTQTQTQLQTQFETQRPAVPQQSMARAVIGRSPPRLQVAQPPRFEVSKFDHRRSLIPPMPPPPMPQPPPHLPQSLLLLDSVEDVADPAGGWQMASSAPPPAAAAPAAARRGELADQHLHRLFEEIYAIRGEAETVQFKYRRERDAWAYENAALQARLSELTEQLRDRSGQLTALDAAYSDEVESLRSENRELHMRIQEDRLAREAEFVGGGGGGGSSGEQASAEKQVDELMAELYALKRELEKLQNRYRKERERWAARRRDLEQAIDDLATGRDPKAVQKRLAQLSAADTAAAAAEEAPGVDEREDLAQASMTYYSSANAVKKEKAILELELEDEKRKNRVLEIEVEVLRDQVMRAQNKARGEDGQGGAGSAEDGFLEKGSLETPEKRMEARRASAVPGASRDRTASGLTQPQEQSLQAAEKILKMEDRLHEKNMELTSQQQQLSQLKRDSEQSAARLEEVQQRREALQQKLAETKEELKAASAERDRAVEENARLKEESERRKDDNRRMREELARVGELEEKDKEAKRRDAEEKERLQGENRDLKDKLDRLRRENDDELERLRAEKRKLEEKLRGIRDKMQDGQKNYKHFQGGFEELAKMCE